MKKLMPILIIFVVLTGYADAQLKVGTTAASFLGISVGPRATAMGGAYTALSNDVTSLYWNPGAFSRAGKSQFLISHTKWLVETSFNWLGFMINLDGVNALGFNITMLDYGEEEVTTVSSPEGTGQNWGAQDFAAGISYCRNLTDRFSIGGTFKYIQQKIWNESSTSFAFDVGLLFVTQFNNMRMAMSISNFGNDMQLDGRDLLHRIDIDPENMGNNETIVARLKTENYPLPLFFRVGVAMDVYKIADTKMTVALDALRPSDNSETLNAGVELAFKEMLFLRGGYKSLFRQESEEGLTFGAGINYFIRGLGKINFEYAFADYGLFDGVHIYGFGMEF